MGRRSQPVGVDIPRARLAGWRMLIRGPVDRSGTA